MKDMLRGVAGPGLAEDMARVVDESKVHHQQCDVNYFEIRRAVGPFSVWSYEFHKRTDGRMPSPEGMRPYEMLPITGISI
jgi:hypothetical protein